MFFSLALLVSALIVPTVLGVPSALSGNAVEIDARGSTTSAQVLVLIPPVIAAVGSLQTAMAPISAAHSTCSAVSQAQAQVKALTSCILSSSGPVVSCATGQNVLGILSLNNAFGAGLCSLDPLSNLSGLLGGLLGSLGGLGGLSGLLSCLVGGTVALLNSILALNGCGCDPSLIGGLLAAVQGLLRDLNALLACGRSCTSCNSGQITNEVLALIAKSGLN